MFYKCRSISETFYKYQFINKHKFHIISLIKLYKFTLINNKLTFDIIYAKKFVLIFKKHVKKL